MAQQRRIPAQTILMLIAAAMMLLASVFCFAPDSAAPSAAPAPAAAP